MSGLHAVKRSFSPGQEVLLTVQLVNTGKCSCFDWPLYAEENKDWLRFPSTFLPSPPTFCCPLKIVQLPPLLDGVRSNQRNQTACGLSSAVSSAKWQQVRCNPPFLPSENIRSKYYKVDNSVLRNSTSLFKCQACTVSYFFLFPFDPIFL